MATKNGVELVCFDLGRVLVRICDDWRHACRVAAVQLPSSAMTADAHRRLFEVVCQSEIGAIDQHAFAESAAPLLGLSVEGVLALSDAYILGPFEGAGELLEDLASIGVRTACLSNTNANHWRIMCDGPPEIRLPMDRLTYRFASHLAGCRKPADEIYAHVERETGCDGRSILFFDDLEENIEAAQRRGWRGFRIMPGEEPVAQIRRCLREANIV